MATDPNRIASYSDLLDLLAREGVLHQARTEEKSVTVPTEKGTLDGMLLMRWQDSDGIIQFIQSLPLEIPADKIPLIESAIRRRRGRAEFRVLLGDARQQAGDAAGAQAAWREALELDPDNRAAHQRLGE